MDLTALFKMSYGVYVVGSQVDGCYSGCIATTAMQVTGEEVPKLIVVINKQNYTHELIQRSKKANISVLSEKANFEWIGKFGFRSGRNVNKLEGIRYEIGENQVPIIVENTVATYETKVIEEVDVGTHTIFILLLENAKIWTQDPVMTYDYYHKVIKGGVPKTAATYVEEKDEEADKRKFRCNICGYIYEEGIEKVKFEDLPEDWVCPICKAPKSQFKLME